LAASAQIEKLKEQQKIKADQLKQQREKEKAALEKANMTSKTLSQLKSKKIGSFNHTP
jgi:hypothetical protein